MTKLLTRAALAIAVVLATAPHTAEAAGAALGGSPASMRRQHGVAVKQDYTFLKTGTQVRTFADEGRLEPVEENADYALSDVSYPYARPEVRLFVERLAAQYHAATGERLVVTSLVRPAAEQPGNASPLSVHPAGMAVDLRIPASAIDRAWLERTLLALEAKGVLDVTREHRPPHYHVAVFPAAYRAWVDRQTAAPAAPVAAAPTPVAPEPASTATVAPMASVVIAAPARSAPRTAGWLVLPLALVIAAAAAVRYRLASLA